MVWNMMEPIQMILIVLMDEDGPATTCTNTPTSAKEVIEGIERPCIFPYYIDGRLINDTCFKLNQENFLDPVSRCPIWPIKTKIDDINSYNSSDSRLIFGGYCKDSDGVLDPELDCPLSKRFTAFSTCKNNCKGGKSTLNAYKQSLITNAVVFPIVSSGAALVFASSAAATSTLLPQIFAGGLGILGIGKQN